MDPLDLWVRTSAGLVRADQIMCVTADTQGRLSVTLSLIETVGSRSVGDVAQVERTIGQLDVQDREQAEDMFVGFVAQYRSDPLRKRGGVITLINGRLKFHEFPAPPQPRLPRPFNRAP